MASNDGPPARNTRAARRSQTREVQSVPARGEQATTEQSDAHAHSEAPAPREESILTSIAGSASDASNRSEGIAPEDNAPSEQGTIREISEEPYEREQSFTTAPGSFGPSTNPAGFSTTPSEAPMNRRKGRMAYTPAQREVDTSSWNRRETPPHLSSKDEKWDHLLGKVDFWSTAARKNKEETVRVRQQLSALQTDITDCYHRSDDVLNAFQDIRGGIEEL